MLRAPLCKLLSQTGTTDVLFPEAIEQREETEALEFSEALEHETGGL